MIKPLLGTVTATLFCVATAAAASLPSRDERLLPLVTAFKLKNYTTVERLAARVSGCPECTLMSGLARLAQGRYDDAATSLAQAANEYPLLADYALFYQAEAMQKGGRRKEAAQVLQSLQKSYPESPLLKKSALLEGRLLFEEGAYGAADRVYQKFVEKYASGSDALEASYRSALCREKLGDLAGAGSMLRTLWLNSPASPQAALAEADMKRLAASGAPVQVFTPQELYKRASALYEKRSYRQAVATLDSIAGSDEKKEFIDRVAFKKGQSLLKAREYGDAERIFRDLASSAAKDDLKSEAWMLMAKAIDKTGRSELAFSSYSSYPARFPGSKEADDALLDAAFIRKFQNRPKETAALMERILEAYPETGHRNRVIWEAGWANYRDGNHIAAMKQFSRLSSVEEYRERALYWHGRAAAAAGYGQMASESFGFLQKEFPFGFYQYAASRRGDGEFGAGVPVLSTGTDALFPVPAGHDRIKALMAIGMLDDASLELSAAKSRQVKGRADSSIARFYLDLGNYNGAMKLFDQSMLKGGAGAERAWAALFPRAYGDMVLTYAARAGIDPSLAYAVMRAESAFAPTATSPVGARGLMQLMPATAAQVLNVKKLDSERLYEPELNIRLGTRHLKELLDSYHGNLPAVIASYNAGSVNVKRWMQLYGSLSEDEFIESIPFGETRDYVKKVLATAAIYRRLYGIR